MLLRTYSPLSLGLLLAVFACMHSAPLDSSELFDQAPFHTVLGFDLRRDSAPRAEVTLRAKAVPQPTQQTLHLPFQSSHFGGKEKLRATWGSYPHYTIVTFVESALNVGTHSLELTPVFGHVPDGLVDTSRLQDGAFLVRSGLERHFILNLLPNPNPLLLSTRELDAVGVALPAGSAGLEIRDSLTTIPVPAVVRADIKFFALELSGARINRIEVRYRVKPTSLQETILRTGLSLVAAIMVPLLTLLFLPDKDTKNPGLRRFGIVAMIGAQVAVLTVLILVGKNSEWFGAGPVADFVVAVVGAICLSLVLITKRGNGGADAGN